MLGIPEKECEKFRESFSGMQLNAQQDAIEEIITKVKRFSSPQSPDERHHIF